MTEDLPTPSVKRCDRRISRAAREIVRVHLVAAWKSAHEATQDDFYNLDVTEWTVWQLIEKMTTPKETALPVRDCPLRRDAFRFQEENSIELDLTISRKMRNQAMPGATSVSRQRFSSYHQCGVCHKNFTSQFYLDEHYGFAHGDIADLADDVDICPASQWCSFISATSCYDAAASLEPFHEPGNAGKSQNLYMMHHKLMKQAPSCTKESMMETSQQCRAMVNACFGPGTVRRNIETSLCSLRPCYADYLPKLFVASPLQPLDLSDTFTPLQGQEWPLISLFLFLALVTCFCCKNLERTSASNNRLHHDSTMTQQRIKTFRVKSGPTTPVGRTKKE